MSKPIKILTEVLNYSISVVAKKYNIAIDIVTIAEPTPGIGNMIIESTFIIG